VCGESRDTSAVPSHVVRQEPSLPLDAALAVDTIRLVRNTVYMLFKSWPKEDVGL
jgi:hypothetical protein